MGFLPGQKNLKIRIFSTLFVLAGSVAVYYPFLSSQLSVHIKVMSLMLAGFAGPAILSHGRPVLQKIVIQVVASTFTILVWTDFSDPRREKFGFLAVIALGTFFLALHLLNELITFLAVRLWTEK